MKPTILSLFLLCCGIITANAQISEKQLKPFITKGYTLADASGDGLKKSSGDILLELVSDEPDVMETLILLHNEKGKLKKMAENSSLLMGKGMLGVSGSNYPYLSGRVLSVDYSLGSNSAVSDVSIKFEKAKDGQYKFKEYTGSTKNYGVENLKERQKITAAQTGTINFSDATENLILKKANTKTKAENNDEPVSKAQNRYAKYIPNGFRLATFAEGDLNLDALKKDIVLVVYNENGCQIKLLIQQSKSTYHTDQTNNKLIDVEETFNAKNLKAVIKNGYFTIEQRVATGDNNFDQRYITFKYDATQKTWLLHRFDVEHYSGFNTKPSKEVTHLTKNEFGNLLFSKMDHLPGVYAYDPALSVLSGTLTKKQFYGKPNYGETPENDEKVWVYILKPDFPVNVYGDIDPQDPETADKTVTNITEIQVYSTDKKMDFKNYLNKKIKLNGLLFRGRNAHHHTEVLMEVKKIVK